MTYVKSSEELDQALARYKDAARVTGKQISTHTLVAGIPYAGGAILELADGLAHRRTQERLNTVFAGMKDCLDRLSAEKLDREFFDSEEFQSLLFLLIEKLQTTHDADKLKNFANALANSGNVDFKADDKELYVRVLRDLGLNDLRVLNDARLKGWLPHTRAITYTPEVICSLSRLQAMGLVLETLTPKQVPPGTTGSERMDARAAFADLIIKPPTKNFYLSEFGERFLRFISPAANPNDPK
jgi:hypothetical protein